MVAWSFPVHLVGGSGWPDWITAIATVFAAIFAAATAVLILISAILARQALRDSRRTRHGQLIIELTTQWRETFCPELLELYGHLGADGITRLVRSLYGPGRKMPTPTQLRQFSTLMRAPDLIEMIGILVEERALGINVVQNAWGLEISKQWTMWKSATRILRRAGGTPTFEHFEWLAKEMRRRPPLPPAEQRLARFSATASRRPGNRRKSKANGHHRFLHR
jgi:hypothetical protein